MKCDCKDWKENIEKVNAPLLLQSARSGFRVQYEGVTFRFCPWCSKPLVEPGSGVLAGQARTEAAVQQKPDGAPVDTAVQTKTGGSGLSVGERIAEKVWKLDWFRSYDIHQAFKKDIAAIINQEVNATKDKNLAKH